MISLRTAFLALSVLLAVGASGCVQQRVLTPEQAAAERDRTIQMTTRVYPDKKPEDVIKAADYVLRLADHDYEFVPTPNGFQAHREWWIYFVFGNQIGSDWWQVSATPEGAGTKLFLTHSGTTNTNTVAPAATVNTGGGMGMGVAGNGSSVQGTLTTKPGLYSLFYSRLEHVLYGRGEWLDCKKAKLQFTDKSLDPLCRCSDDNPPAMTPKNAAQR